MTGFLKFLGTVNAAVWLGATVSLTLAILPSVFSHEMRVLLTPARHASGDDAGFTGAVAMVIFSRFFILQYVCGSIAMLHALAGDLYLGRALKTFTNGVLILVLGLSLMGGFWLQPEIRRLHSQRYDTHTTAAQKEQANRSMKLYHGLSEALNLVALVGLTVYFWRVSHQNDPARMAGFSHKFRG